MDDARLIAWIDGALEPAEARRVAAAVAADPALAARAETHRKLKARVSAAFGPLLEDALPRSPRKPAPVVSLADARAQRQAREKAQSATDAQPRRWAWPGIVGIALLVGILAVHQLGDDTPAPATADGIGDRSGALALAPTIADALDTQIAGQAGAVRVTRSFRDKAGAICRSFTGAHLGGVACHGAAGWLLRYAAPAAGEGDQRLAGSDAATLSIVQTMIAGVPFDAAQEKAALAAHWK